MPSQKGELHGDGQDMGEEVPRTVHDLDGGLAIFHADVHVQAEDQVGARHHLQVLDDGRVPLVGIDLLVAPWAKGCVPPAASRRPFWRARVMICRRMERISSRRLLNGVADAGADLDHRLVHLRLDALGENRLALLHDLGGDVRTQVPRLGIDGLVFLLDPDVETGAASANGLVIHDLLLYRSTCPSAPAAQKLRPVQLRREGCSSARSIAMSATASTTHLKFSWPTDSSPASGAGFMKSMA